MRNRRHDAWIFTTLKTITMKNRCTITAHMFYNITLRQKNRYILRKLRNKHLFLEKLTKIYALQHVFAALARDASFMGRIVQTGPGRVQPGMRCQGFPVQGLRVCGLGVA